MHSSIYLGDLINSEGSILKTTISDDGMITLIALSNEPLGHLHFQITFKNLVNYLESKSTLYQLFQISDDKKFIEHSKEISHNIDLNSLIDKIPFFMNYFNEVPDTMK